MESDDKKNEDVKEQTEMKEKNLDERKEEKKKKKKKKKETKDGEQAKDDDGKEKKDDGQPQPEQKDDKEKEKDKDEQDEEVRKRKVSIAEPKRINIIGDDQPSRQQPPDSPKSVESPPSNTRGRSFTFTGFLARTKDDKSKSPHGTLEHGISISDLKAKEDEGKFQEAIRTLQQDELGKQFVEKVKQRTSPESHLPLYALPFSSPLSLFFFFFVLFLCQFVCSFFFFFDIHQKNRPRKKAGMQIGQRVKSLKCWKNTQITKN
jgi:hypothetical protein